MLSFASNLSCAAALCAGPLQKAHAPNPAVSVTNGADKGPRQRKIAPMTAAYQDPNGFEEGSVKFV